MNDPQFPDGKLSADDRGSLDVVVHAWNDRVRVDFGESLTWLGMPPAEARELARALMACADRIEAGDDTRPA